MGNEPTNQFSLLRLLAAVTLAAIALGLVTRDFQGQQLNPLSCLGRGFIASLLTGSAVELVTKRAPVAGCVAAATMAIYLFALLLNN